jgi:HlyD family secretion protein
MRETRTIGPRRTLARSLVIALTAAAVSAACARQGEPDAYGNIEATEVIVSAEVAGRLISFSAEEGADLAEGAAAGMIDATELSLDRDQAAAERAGQASRLAQLARQIQASEAQRSAARADRAAAAAQRVALDVQHDVARRAYERSRRLFAEQATTTADLERAERDVRVLAEQIRAQDEQLRARDAQIDALSSQIDALAAERQSAAHRLASADAAAARTAERLAKSTVRNPVGGSVLATYAEAGEFVQRGQPLYKIANLDSMEARVYVAEPQLARLRLGQRVRMAIDTGRGERRTLPGTVSWISPRAEFTPTPIQTREERADLVYAVKIRVANEGGILKIGMPIDVRFEPDRAP